jgi:hypothetical protein
MSETRTCTAAEIPSGLAAAIAELAAKYGLGDVVASATTTWMTTVERPAGLFSKAKQQRSVIVLTKSDLVWAVEDGDDATANGGHLKDLELRPPIDPSMVGLHVYGLLFRGAAERASTWIGLAAGGTTNELRAAVEAALRR